MVIKKKTENTKPKLPVIANDSIDGDNNEIVTDDRDLGEGGNENPGEGGNENPGEGGNENPGEPTNEMVGAHHNNPLKDDEVWVMAPNKAIHLDKTIFSEGMEVSPDMFVSEERFNFFRDDGFFIRKAKKS